MIVILFYRRRFHELYLVNGMSLVGSLEKAERFSSLDQALKHRIQYWDNVIEGKDKHDQDSISLVDESRVVGITDRLLVKYILEE